MKDSLKYRPLLIQTVKLDDGLAVQINPVELNDNMMEVGDVNEELGDALHQLTLATSTIIRKIEFNNPEQVGKVLKMVQDQLIEMYVEPNVDLKYVPKPEGGDSEAEGGEIPPDVW